MLVQEYEADAVGSAFIDEFGDHGWFEGEVPPEAGVQALLVSGAAHDAAVWALEDITVQARALTAAQYRAIAAVIEDAAAVPDPWVGPDPTLDPLWVDRRGRSVARVRADRREMAVRAAVADIAVRVRLSETAVRSRATDAQTLSDRCPRVWALFLAGSVSEQNAITTAQYAMSLPPEDPAGWAVFDEQVEASVVRLAPGKYRTKARAVRERVHRESLEARHRRAARDRAVWVTPELDGMATLTAVIPAAAAYAAYERVDATARHLRGQDGEDRTLAQLRADVLADLLVRGSDADAAAVSASVAVTVPVLTLLGQGEEPAVLDGYGPIDTETARRLSGGASSWVRILTHPVTGTVLDLDRTTYRVPKALRRWLGVRDPVCVFPGCARKAKDCDIDHRVQWQYGGVTSEANLAPECEPHHHLRHDSEWDLHRDPVSGQTWWISPTAHATDTDPPPW